MGLWLEQLRRVVAAHEVGHWWVFQVAAMAACLAWFTHRARGANAPLRACLVAGFAGAAVGAVALGLLLRIPAWLRAGLDPTILLHGQVMAFGALLGLTLVYAGMARRRGFDPARALDRLAPPAGLLVVFARLGCFVAGCDFGSPADVPWAVRYPADSAAYRHQLHAGLRHGEAVSLPVHPAQLYEAVLGVGMAAAALAVERSARGRARPGSAFAAAAIVYAAGRALVELCRGDERGALGPFSTPQWLSVMVLGWLALQAFPTAHRTRPPRCP